MIGEAGRNAGEFERRLQERLPHAFAFLVPIAVATVSLVKIHGGKDGVVPYEFGVFYTVYAHGFAFAHPFLIKDAETVTGAQAEEIHGPGIYIGQFQDDGGGGIGRDHIVPEGGGDGDIGRLLHYLHGLVHGIYLQGVRAAEDGAFDLAVVVDHIVGDGESGIGVVGVPGFAGHQTAHVEDGVAALHQCIRILAAKAQTSEKGGEVLSGFYYTAAADQGVRLEPQGIGGFHYFLHFLFHRLRLLTGEPVTGDGQESHQYND